MAISLEELKDILMNHRVKPADYYAAAAGAGYGLVTSWDLGGIGFLIWYRGNDVDGFAIHENDDDLASWLELDPLHPLDAMLRTANVRGVDDVPDADPTVNYSAAYVLVTRCFNGWATKSPTEFAPKFSDPEPRPFMFIKDAQEWIDEEKDKLYILSEGEIREPNYKIVTV